MRIYILLIAFHLSNFLTLLACDCPPLKPLDKSYTDQFDLIFVGTVDSVVPCKEEKANAVFTIQKLFKGASPENANVNFDCSSSCQMSLVKGEQWIIYANYAKYAVPEIMFCERNRKKFSNDSLDYFVSGYMLTFNGEEAKLEEMLGSQSLLTERDNSELQRELLKPKGYGFLWVLVASAAAFMALLYLSKKIKK